MRYISAFFSFSASFLKWGSTLKGKNLLHRSKFFSLREDPGLEGFLSVEANRMSPKLLLFAKIVVNLKVVP